MADARGVRSRRSAGCGVDSRLAIPAAASCVRAFLERLGRRQAVQRIGHGAHQLRDAFAGSGRDGVKFEPARGAKFAQFFKARAVRRRVQFCGHDDHRLLRKFFAERGKLSGNDLKIVHGIAVGSVAGVDQMRDQPRALDVPQKSDAQSSAGVRAFNQAGQIRHDKRAPAALFRWLSRSAVGGNDAEARLQRRKRIIRDFRMGRGNARDERGLSRVRKSDQAHVRQQLQLKVQDGARAPGWPSSDSRGA